MRLKLVFLTCYLINFTFCQRLKFFIAKCLCVGMRKRDAVCEPLRPDTAQGQQNIKFLRDAIEIFTIWKLSGKAGLTIKTFMACIQSMQAMIGLVDHLTNQHSYLYILPGKFSSDPIEGRFGC